MKLKTHIVLRIIAIFVILTPVHATAQETPNSSGDRSWYLKPTLGFSSLSNTSGFLENSSGESVSVSVDADSGFVSGLTLGYRYGNNWVSELGWEYRSNDSSSNFSNGIQFEEGDYASNTFFLNGIYEFNNGQDWTPYLGGGLVLIQEIDIDLESAGEEMSFSDSGNVGYQLFAGVNRDINDRWSFDLEVRYSSVSGIDMEGEASNQGTLNDLDYNTTTLQAGLRYRF